MTYTIPVNTNIQYRSVSNEYNKMILQAYEHYNLATETRHPVVHFFKVYQASLPMIFFLLTFRIAFNFCVRKELAFLFGAF